MDSGSEIDAILKPKTVLLEIEIDSMLKIPFANREDSWLTFEIENSFESSIPFY